MVCQASLSITISWSMLKLMSIQSVMPSNHLVLCCPLHLLPSIFPSIWVFSSELALRIRWPKYWIFSFGISLSNEYSGLISFRIDWFDLLAAQGTLQSLLQHHSLEVSIIAHSVFFMVQLSHLYMTAGKTIALTRWTFVGKVMSLHGQLFLWENVSYCLQQEERNPALPNRKFKYFTTPEEEGRFLSCPATSPVNRKCCSSVNEKLLSPELLLSSNELLLFSY